MIDATDHYTARVGTLRSELLCEAHCQLIVDVRHFLSVSGACARKGPPLIRMGIVYQCLVDTFHYWHDQHAMDAEATHHRCGSGGGSSKCGAGCTDSIS